MIHCFFSQEYLCNFGFVFGLVWLRNLSMNFYFFFLFNVKCCNLVFGVTFSFYVVISKVYYSFHKHCNKNLYFDSLQPEIWKFSHVLGSDLFFILSAITDCASRGCWFLVNVKNTILDAYLKSHARTVHMLI